MIASTWNARADRHDSMPYRHAGRSGLKLPALSLGLWQNFGEDRDPAVARSMILRAFDLGITHFDLANNYGPPPGSAELFFGEMLAGALAPYRDEIVVSTKAGFPMWTGPYGSGSSRKHLLSSLDQSLRRMKLDYVDIFYSHRFDKETPLDETMEALATAVRQGKALYAGISSYPPTQTREAAALLRACGAPCLIHQPSYSMFNRWIEDGLTDALTQEGMGCIVFSPLAQGLLTGKYLGGIPSGSRKDKGAVSLRDNDLAPALQARLPPLMEIAAARGQSLAQMALAWVLRLPQITSTLIGASRISQLEENLGALKRLDFAPEELAAIDRITAGADLNRRPG